MVNIIEAEDYFYNISVIDMLSGRTNIDFKTLKWVIVNQNYLK